MEGLFSFYEVHLRINDCKSDIYGFILPCTFTILMGTNFKVAWGFTANYPEMYNIYKLSVSGIVGKYLTVDEKAEKLKSKYYLNYTKLFGRYPYPIFKKYYQSKLGNIININGKYLLIKIPILGKSLGSETNYNLMKCSSNTEVKELCFSKRYGYLNFVSIDENDNILYIHNALEQVKENVQSHKANFIDLKLTTQISDNFYGTENLIYTENPKCDYLVSVNQSPFKVTNDLDIPKTNKFKGLLYYNENSRSIRIKSLLDSFGKLDCEDLKEILFDTKIIKPVIRNIDFSVLFDMDEFRYPKLEYLIRLLKIWDGVADLNSEGAALFSLFYYHYKENHYVSSKDSDVIKLATADEIIGSLTWSLIYFKPKMLLKDIQFIKRGTTVLPIGGIPDSINSIRPFFEKGKLFAEEGGGFRLIIDLKLKQIFSCHPFGSTTHTEQDNSSNQMKLFTKN
ncbi:MAG: hypothetical protein EOP00_30020, partial [Pedobacter sp.]